jgi:hypothetical protein
MRSRAANLPWKAVAVVLTLLVLVFGALHWWRPYAELRRLPITSSPGLEPLFGRADITLLPRHRLCVAPVALDTDTAIAQFKVTATRSPQPLVVLASGPDYRSTYVVRDYMSNTLTPVPARLTSPPHDIVGRVCVTNRGHRPVALLGTNEPRSLSASHPTLGGRTLLDQGVALELYASKPQSILSRTGTILSRAAAFTGDLAPVWLLWPLLVVLVAGAPLAIVAGFAAALRNDRR